MTLEGKCVPTSLSSLSTIQSICSPRNWWDLSLPIPAAEASLGASLRVLKLTFVENNDIIEWVELGQAFLNQSKEKWSLYDFCTYGSFPVPSIAPMCPTAPFSSSFPPEVTGLQKTGSLHICSSCISLPGERSRWTEGYNGCIISGVVSFSSPLSPSFLSGEKKGKSWKGSPLKGDWSARERGDSKCCERCQAPRILDAFYRLTS